MISCKETRNRAYLFLDRALDPPEAAAVEDHLATCAACAAGYARERAFLDRIAWAGRERAPEHLRRRVEAVLAGRAAGASEAGAGSRRWAAASRWRRAGAVAAPLAAAAALAFLLLGRPGGDPPGAGVAPGFAADHAAHAVAAPSEIPFPRGVDPPGPPGLGRARLVGLSRCMVDGRAYAHYVFAVEEGKLSVFLPLAEAPVLAPGAYRVDGAAVLAASSNGDTAVLVSTDLSPEELAAVWNDA